MKIRAAIAAGSLALAIASCSSEVPAPPAPPSAVPTSFDTMLTMTVDAGGSGCSKGGYSDIRSGAQVEVINQKNEVLAVGNLDNTGPDCQFWSLIKGVPAGEKLYGVKVGNANRGVIWKTEDEARGGGGWTLTLGG